MNYPEPEFYIGWEEKMPPMMGRVLKRVAACLIGLMLVIAVVLAWQQRGSSRGVFEWGKIKRFEGTWMARPVPHLLVERPGAVEAAWSAYLLVRRFKFGISPETAERFAGKRVALEASLIYRGGQTMLEVLEDSITPIQASSDRPLRASMVASVSLGEKSLVGEIVDSKCHFGVMNPGSLASHRACAVRCISGGCPPILLVRHLDGTESHYLLVSREGHQVHREVLSLVAEPVAITGEVVRQGSLLVLRADPSTYRPLAR